ncbi:hypothetical protein H8959_006369, partial [Pygathrix nigripes]
MGGTKGDFVAVDGAFWRWGLYAGPPEESSGVRPWHVSGRIPPSFKLHDSGVCKFPKVGGKMTTFK